MTTKRNILVFMGTRPEAVKLAPVVAALRASRDFHCTVVATGQHKEMFRQVADTFGFAVDADLDVMRPNQTLAGLTARLIAGIDEWLETAKPDMALVQGDTTTVLTASLACFYRRIPIGHVLSCTRGRTPEQRAYITFSHRPESGLDEQALREAIAAGLDRNLALIEGPRDLLFSGGVDSALLALRAVHTGFANRAWFYSVSRGDPERAIAQQAASTIGLDLKVVHDETTPEDIADRIGAYALPTLDFSILPTYALGSAVVESRGRTTFIDGTGGDAWFGFGSLAHASRWLPLHRFRMLSPAARRLYLQILRWEHLRPLRLVKGLARTPNLPSAALGHLCANPVYSSLLDLTQEEWREIECDLLDLMRSLTGGEVGSAKSEVIVSDATLIAVAQFAAKTSQWDLAGEAGTFYPFLMPNLVALGQKMPPELLLRGGTAKPLLKDLVAQSALGHSFAYRRKSGFQPPLQRLLQDESAREILFSSPSVGVDDSAWTKTARELPERLLSDRNTLRIGGLYPIWAAIAIKLWLKSLRQLGA